MSGKGNRSDREISAAILKVTLNEAKPPHSIDNANHKAS